MSKPFELVASYAPAGDQPKAYVPPSDTYIEKDASINEHIAQMRLSATKALLERPDVIIVATVSSIERAARLRDKIKELRGRGLAA